MIWSTSDSSIALADGGIVTAVARGAATITATTHNGIEATCAVTVEDRIVDLTLRVPDGTPAVDGVYDVRAGATLQISSDVKPKGIGHTLSFKSTDGSVASVSGAGVVKGIKNGFATITVTARDTAGRASQTRKLNVHVVTPVSKVTLPAEAQILAGASKKLTAAVSAGKRDRQGVKMGK